MKASLPITLFALFVLPAMSQSFSYKQEKFAITKHQTVNLSEQSAEPDWNVSVLNLEMPAPGGSDYRSFLRQQKAVQRELYPLRNSSSQGSQRSSVSSPDVGRMFEGNAPTLSVPCDNNMAISNDGKLISVINSTIYIYDLVEDSLLYDANFNTFTSFQFGTPAKYDPKIIYDPQADRFFFTFLRASTPNLSLIIFAVSEPGNPTGEWSFYSLPGNPFDNNRWTDYPALSQNASDFFITANFIIPGEPWQTGFDGSMIWQIDKESVYSAEDDMEAELLTDFTWGNTLIRNLNPVDGEAFFDRNNMYLLSNRNFALENDTIFLLEVTNTLASGAAEVTIQALTSSQPYYLAPEARQANDHIFDTNDSRVLGAVLFDDDNIQFVQNCLDPESGVTAVYHGFIENLSSSPTVSGNIVSFPQDDLDIGYPNISLMGTHGVDQNTLLSFVHTGPTHFAGTSCVYYDHTQQDYSERIVLKEGDNYVNVLSGTYDRWGDYSGSQPVYGTPGNVWIAGSFGLPNQRHGTWLAELSISGQFVSVQEQKPAEPAMQLTAFPNPMRDMFSLEITHDRAFVADVSLFDIQGRVVAQLYNDRIKEGRNLLSFDMGHLAGGTYILRVMSENGETVTEKVIKR